MTRQKIYYTVIHPPTNVIILMVRLHDDCKNSDYLNTHEYYHDSWGSKEHGINTQVQLVAHLNLGCFPCRNSSNKLSET